MDEGFYNSETRDRFPQSQNPPEEHFGQADDPLTRLYRYLLILSADEQEAQAVFASTLRAAAHPPQSFDPDRPADRVRLFRAARYQKDFGRHARSSRAGAAFHELSETNEQAALRAAIRRISALLGDLPALQAEILALTLFAGLTIEEAGQVVGKSPPAAAELARKGLAGLSRRLSGGEAGSGEVEAGLRSLAQDIHLTAEMTVNARSQWPSDAQAGDGAEKPAPDWLRRYRLRAALRRGLRVAPLAVLAAALIAGYVLTQPFKSRSASAVALFGASAQPTPSTGAPNFNLSTDPLVPPDETVCRQWQNTLSQALQVSVDLHDRAPFYYPGSPPPRRVGMGCDLRASSVTANNGEQAGIMDRLSSLLTKNGFQRQTLFTCNHCGRFDQSDASRGGNRQIALFTQGKDIYAVLTVSWDADGAPNLSASPGEPTGEYGAALGGQALTVRLMLAETGQKSELNLPFNQGSQADLNAQLRP